MNRYGARAIEEFIYIWDARFFIFAIILIAMASSVQGAMQTINDQYAYISAQQSLINSGYVPMELQVKTLNASYDIAFGFNSSMAIPRFLEVWVNNYTITNSTGTTIPYENYTRLNPDTTINYVFDGKDRWYVFQNLNLNTNRRYIARAWIDVYGSGKYDIAAKLSSDTIQNAVANSRFYFLDPTFDTYSNLSMYYNFNATSGNVINQMSPYGTLVQVGSISNQTGLIAGARGVFSDAAYFTNATFGVYSRTTPYTACIWMYPTTTQNYATFFIIGDGSTANGYVQMQMTGTQYKIDYFAFGAGKTSTNAVIQNQWNQLCLVNYPATSNFSIYINGIYDSYGTSSGSVSSNGAITIGRNAAAGYYFGNGYLDELGIWNRSLNGSEINQTYYNGLAKIALNTPPASTNPTISFDKQVPANITIANVLSKSINISYNYTLISPNNLTNAMLFYNLTTGDGKPCIFVNGTIACGNFNTTSISNTSTTITFRLFDASLLPATYNFPERDMEQTPHINATMQDYLKINLNNISSTRNYGFFEIMATNTSGAILPVYFCNSSYGGGKPETNLNCGQFGSIDPKPYDHIHSIYSAHHVVPFVVANGTIAGVGVTSRGSFIIPGSANWIFMYIANVSRANATMLSNNQGNTFTSVVGTADAHLHQFDPGNDSITYYACINQTDGAGICSASINSLVGLSVLPPSAPIVISPTNGTYNGTLLINYTASTSATGMILYYGINLEDSNHNQVYTIIANNSLALTYNFNTSFVSNGQYYAIVTAFDNQTLNTTGESALFTIDNFIPPTPVAAGDAITRATDRFFFVFIVFLAIIAYFFSFFIGTIGSLVLKLMSFALFMSSGAFVPDVKFTYLVIAFSSLVMIHLVVHFILIASGDVDA